MNRSRPVAPSAASLPGVSPLDSRAFVHNASHWISHWAARRPERAAWADDERRRTWAQAEDEVARLAAWLRARGVGAGDRVALWLGNRVETLEALFASARLGAIALPINARLTPAEVAFQLDDARPSELLVEPAWRERAEQALALCQRAAPGCTAVDDALRRELAGRPALAQGFAASPEDAMILMYTSGTTGKPKGALLPHRKALYNSLNAQLYFDLRSDDRVLVVAPLFHSLGLQILALPAVYVGAAVRLQEGFDAERVWRTIEQEAITYFGGVPTMHQRLLEALEAGRPSPRPPRSLRFAFTAGAAAPRELIQAFHRHGLLLKQGYGQTETSILTCLEPEQALEKAGSVGRPVLHAELRLIDPDGVDGPVERWRDVAPGEVGEIVVRGPITMLGYWERPEASAETLREGWIRTGDLATRDADFDVTLVGRAREMYISGGENVYPAEVEASLVEHPDVAEAAVVAVEDPEWGEVGRAHVVQRGEASLEAGVLLDWLRGRLARFKLPREIVFEEALPRTASGKVQKHRLRSRSSGGGASS